MPWLLGILSNVLLASLLALAAWFVQRRLRMYGVARILWVLVLIKLVTPAVLSVPLRQSPGLMACTLGICGCGQHAGRQAIWRETLPWALLGAWSIGAAAKGLIAWRRWARFRRLLAHASPAPPEWQTLAARLSLELSVRVSPEILAVPGRLPPLVIPGRRRPRMLLPMDLLDRLDRSQREALLLHELVHIRRGDHLVRMLELMVGVAFWWLPCVGSIGRQLRACEEACCDAAVVSHRPLARRDYARLLLDVVDFANPLPRQALPQATAMSAAADLEQRLRSILDATSGARRTWPAAVFAAKAIAVGLACAVLPCGLQCEFVARTAPAAPAVEMESVTGETCEPGGERQEAAFRAMCCPS